MNRIILIGNGFDIANNLDTRYSDFIKWLWEKLNNEYNQHIDKSKEDFNVKDLVTYKPFNNPSKIEPTHLIPKDDSFFNVEKTAELCRIDFENEFFKIITSNFQNKKWVDIEEDYFDSLKDCLNGKYKGGIHQLNKDFNIIKEKLREYLKQELVSKENNTQTTDDITQNFYITDFSSFGLEVIKKEHFSKNPEKFEEIKERLNYIDNYDRIEKFDLAVKPENLLFLNFNYTDLPQKIIDKIAGNNIGYEDWAKIPMECINLHGELNNPQNPMIFGYGDEQNEEHKLIEKKGGEYLDNIKTINYLQTNNYKRLLIFIESDYYQVFIFGLSCGLSDKTLLNTLFEHEHCVSIKPFYYQWEGENKVLCNNYDETIKNIYRVFTDKPNMRDKVVPRKNCNPLKQNIITKQVNKK